MNMKRVNGRPSKPPEKKFRPGNGALPEGESNLEAGNYAHAASIARAILAKDPNHLGGLELLARACWRAGDFERGLDTLRHLIRLNPYEPGYHYLRGSALQALGHYGEAIRAYSRCLESDSDSLRQQAASAIRELERWQEGVIAELIATDRVFRADYQQDPMAACKRRGFAFCAEDTTAAVQLATTRELEAATYVRPS